MEWLTKRLGLGWWRMPPAAAILGFFVASMVVIALAALAGPKTPSNRVLGSGYRSWSWSSIFPGGYMSGYADLVPPAHDGVSGKKLRGMAVGIGGETLNLSAAPPDLEPAVEQVKTESASTSTSTNQSTKFPPTNFNKKITSLRITEANLQKARSAIRSAKQGSDTAPDPDYVPTGPVYWNPSSFQRSYLEMEKQFKVYVYEEGEQPIFHDGPCGSIYSVEGYFMYQLETSKFRTMNPDKAHVYFLPISVTSIVHYIYDGKAHKHVWRPLKRTVGDYVDLVARKYPYWNRSLGCDHLMLACHDWGPELSKTRPWLYENSIRALCNANLSEGFRPSKDVSIPEINLPARTTKGLIGGPSPSTRNTLVFFAGGLHGPIRPILIEHWENKDPDIQIHRYLPRNVSYYTMLRSSKFCICPSGYEVASPRMVEALYTGCVPVLIKDHYVPPFSDVLNWKSFSVEIQVHDIPNLKKVLTGISGRQYIRMQKRGVMVRRHFEVNVPPKRYDVFHMILHSVWLRRLNFQLLQDHDS